MGNIFSKLFNKKEKEEINTEIEQKIDEVETAQEEILEDNSIDFSPIAEEEIEIKAQEIIEREVESENVGPYEAEFVEKPVGFLNKLKEGMTKTRNGIKEKINGMLSTFRKIDEELFEELEEILISSDMGVQTTTEVIENIKKRVKLNNITEPLEIQNLLKAEINQLLNDEESDLKLDTTPSIITVVGVNGVGKTTSIGKLAYFLKASGKKVMLAAADTFRAGAIDQLEIWGKRVGIDVIKHQEGADPGAVVFDAIQSAKAKKIDILICDTAGRLHNKKNLMDELGKVERIINRELPDASKETLLVLDATTGQNAVQQAKTFNETTRLTGIVLTKLDGTAKGGIIIPIKCELGIPVKYVGVGEGINDLQKFDSKDFVNALFED